VSSTAEAEEGHRSFSRLLQELKGVEDVQIINRHREADTRALLKNTRLEGKEHQE